MLSSDEFRRISEGRKYARVRYNIHLLIFAAIHSSPQKTDFFEAPDHQNTINLTKFVPSFGDFFFATMNTSIELAAIIHY